MKLLFLGDLFYDFDYISSDIERIINFVRKNDYKVVVNLETAVVDAQNPIKKRGPNLKSNPIVFEILKKLNCVCVCLSNNHAMDYGGDSLLSTKEALESMGITCVGAGADINQAQEPAIFQMDEVQVIIQNYGWDVEETVYATAGSAGCAPLDRKAIISRTKSIKEKYPDAVLINCFHMGFEFNVYPMPLDISFSHKCVDAGCDLVISHHPHVIQPVEIYKEKNIYYSLGNFYFASRRNNYRKEYEKEPIDSFGDYGLGVVFDLETLKSSEIAVYYNRDENRSIVFDNGLPDCLLPTIEGLDWTSSEYLELAKEHAYKNNPILGLAEKENSRMLRDLKRKYFIAMRIQKYRKYPVVDSLYTFLKERA